MIGTAAELDFMFGDLGVPVVYGGVSLFGDFNTGPMQILDPVAGTITLEERRSTLTIRDGAITVVLDAPITINGVAYLVRDTGFAKSDGTRTLVVVLV